MIYCIKTTNYQDPQHCFFFPVLCDESSGSILCLTCIVFDTCSVGGCSVCVYLCSHLIQQFLLVCHSCPLLLYWCRTERIRWKYVVQYFLEFVFTIVVLVMCLKNFIRPSLEMIPSNPAKCVCPHSHKTSLCSSVWLE